MKAFWLVWLIFHVVTPLHAQDGTIKPLVITHVTVIDATGAPPKPNMTVVIIGDRIKELGKTGRIRIPQRAQVIDASGKFLIPGLWDMHVHTGDKEVFFPLYIANGITGVRDMGGDVENPTGDFSIRFRLLHQWRKQVANGELLGPRIVASGPILDGPKARTPSHINVANADDGRNAVRSLKALGVDFIKVYNEVPRDSYFAIAAEARKQGLAFVGHVPISIRSSEASTAGQKSLEHLLGILQACSSTEDELMKSNLNSDQSISLRARIRGQAQQLLQTYDKKKARALFALFVRNGTWQVPTLTSLQWPALAERDSLTEDVRLRYVPAAWKDAWARRLRELSSEDVANEKRLFDKYLDLINEMRRAGVKFLAGSNSANPFTYPGFSLHDELQLLVKAGLTPMEALQAATFNSARFLGLEQSVGTINRGKIADLVLLDANPLTDISNTRAIEGVINKGVFLSRSRLKSLLTEAERVAKEP